MGAIAARMGEEASWSVRLAAIEGLSTARGDARRRLVAAIAASVCDDRLRPYAARILRSAGTAGLSALGEGVASSDPDLVFGSLRVLDAIARSQPADASLGELPPGLARAVDAIGADRDDRVKAAAVAVRISLLGRKGSEIDPIRDLLASKDERARILALALAARLGGEASKPLVPGLARLLRDDSETVRAGAREVLARIGDTIPPPPGTRFGGMSENTSLAFRSDLQSRAVETLGPDVGPILVDVLLDPRAEVSRQGTAILPLLGDPAKASVVDALLPHLESGDLPLSPYTVGDLAGAFAARIGPLLKSERAEDRRSAVALTAHLGPSLNALRPQVESLLKDDDPEARIGAAVCSEVRHEGRSEGHGGPAGGPPAQGCRRADAGRPGPVRDGPRGRAALEALAKVAKDDADPSVRDAARDVSSSIRSILSRPLAPPSKTLGP